MDQDFSSAGYADGELEGVGGVPGAPRLAQEVGSEEGAEGAHLAVDLRWRILRGKEG